MAYTPPGRTRSEVLNYVRKRLRAGDPPSVREVQKAFGFRSVESARSHLEALVESGALAKRPGRQARCYCLGSADLQVPLAATPDPDPERTWRSALPADLQVRAPGEAGVRVPLLGRIPAGDPTLAVEDREGFLAVPGRRIDDPLFALRVTGESMIEAGILDGDVVVVRQQSTARSGEVVVVMVGDVEGEATVKVLRKRRGGREIVLEPCNPAFTPRVIAADEVRVLGKVIEVRRYLDGRVPLEDEG